MVLDSLGDSLKGTLNKIASSVFVDERLINELVKDIQRALLQADVNVKLVLQVTKGIKERALKEETPGGVTKKEHLIKIVYEELVKFLGSESSEIKVEKHTKIMLLGLFGSGKTTTTGKLAKYFQKRGHKVAAIQLDVYRPAALEQLQQLGKQIGIPVYGEKGEKDPRKIYQKHEKELAQYDVVIVDTAGRDALSEDLIKELNDLGKQINPDEALLVISGDIGQAAQKQAEAFHSAKAITGVIVTKLEGTAKGGGALTACAATGAKVKFIGVGEKVDDLEKFVPERFVGRLLGMGDLETLLEKVKENFSEKDAEDMQKKFMKGEFSLRDLYEQMQAMRKMGPLAKVMEMVPGMGALKMPKEMLKVQEEKLDKWKVVMDSMTEYELQHPEELNESRINRISAGAGQDASAIRELLKQYKQSKKLIKMFKGKDPKNMEQMLKKMGGGQLPK